MNPHDLHDQVNRQIQDQQNQMDREVQNQLWFWRMMRRTNSPGKSGPGSKFGCLVLLLLAIAAISEDSEQAHFPERAGFDMVLLSIGPVVRLAPPASLVAAFLGGRLIYVHTISDARMAAGVVDWLVA